MLTKEGLEFILRITDYFHGHWEDPGWGRREANQLLLQLSVHALAEGIADNAVRTTVQGSLEKSMAGLAQKVASPKG